MSESAVSSRTWKTILGWTLGSLVALLIFAFAYDERLQPYDDLVPAPFIVSGPATNGYLHLQNLWKTRPELRGRDDSWIRKALAHEVPWDEARCNQLLTGWEHTYAELDAALGMRDWVIPLERDPEILPPYRMVGDRLRLIMESSRRRGQRTECLGYLLTELRWSRRQMEQASSWDHLALGPHPLWKIRQWLNEGSATKEEIARLQNYWDLEKVFTERLEICLKQLFGEIRENCTQAGKGPWINSNRHRYNFSKQGRLWFKPNKILNHLHSGSRVVIAHALTPSQEKQNLMDYGYSLFNTPGQGWTRLLDPDAAGKAFRKWMAMGQATLLGDTCSSLFHFRAMATRFALEQWRLDHGGELPVKLEELVPDYLERVPEDPVAGGHITWDAAERTLSSQNPEGGRMKWTWDTAKR